MSAEPSGRPAGKAQIGDTSSETAGGTSSDPAGEVAATPDDDAANVGDRSDGGQQRDASPGTIETSHLEQPVRSSGAGEIVTEFLWSPPHIGDPGGAADVTPRLASEAPERADLRANWAVVGDLTVLGASVRGRSHRFYGTPRQDDYQFVSDEHERIVVFAVADGVSEGSHSHAAASIAVRYGCRLLLGQCRQGEVGPDEQRALGPVDWHGVVEDVARRIIGYGTSQMRRGDSVDEDTDLEAVADAFATTLVLGVIGARLDRGGDRDLRFVAIGDTSVWLLDGRGWQMLAGRQAVPGAVAVSSVAALPRLPHTSVVPVTVKLSPSQRVFVMSDGVGDAMATGTSPLARYLATRWSQPPSVHAFAAHIDFARRAYDDDRTVVGLWPEQRSW